MNNGLTSRGQDGIVLYDNPVSDDTILKNCNYCYMRTSSDGHILEVNSEYCRFSGYSPEELLGKPLKDMESSVNEHVIPAYLPDLIRKNKGSFRLKQRAKNGSSILTNVYAGCVGNKEPEIIFMMMPVDNNESEKSDLISGEGGYWHLFRENKAVMLVIDPDSFDIIDANNQACKYYGWSPEELKKMKISDINTLSPEQIKEEMENAVSQQRNYFLFRHRLSNGEIRDVEVYSSPVNIKFRNLLYSIVHDITDRKLAEQELKTREMQLRTAQNIGHIGSWCFYMDTGEADASDEARRIYGYGFDGSKYSISRVKAISLPEYRPMLNDAMQDLIHNGVPYNLQFKIKRPSDNAIRDVHVVAEYDPEKNIVIGTVEDITDRKRAEDALVHAKLLAEEANRSKDEFLATMSHELRTPLTSVIGFSDVLLDESFGVLDEKQKRYVTHILDAGRHLLQIINDLLDLSKVEAGKMELVYEDFPVSDAVYDVKTMIHPLASGKNIKINISISDKIGIINADKTKFKQILYNLVSNAIKFTPEKGSVDISAYCTEEMLFVSVHDTGIGISPEDVDQLFHPFKQLDSYIAQNSAGTGLGLSLVKKFVEMHDGRVRVESKPGEGSTFSFSIPLKGKAGI